MRFGAVKCKSQARIWQNSDYIRSLKCIPSAVSDGEPSNRLSTPVNLDLQRRQNSQCIRRKHDAGALRVDPRAPFQDYDLVSVAAKHQSGCKPRNASSSNRNFHCAASI
jgi:hypothetical protein